MDMQAWPSIPRRPSCPFPDHPLRVELNDEVYARPPEALVAPVRVSVLALFSD